MTRAPLTDQQLHGAICKRFDWAPEIDATHIAVAVRAGVATLSGEARSVAEKQAAVKAAGEVQGVSSVIDELMVRDAVGTVDDVQIASTTHAVLASHPLLAGRPITVAVHDQVVRLAGLVDTAEQRDCARRAAQAVLGVRAVVDELILPPAPTVSQTRARLAEVLAGAPDADLDKLDVHVEIQVEGHVATLEGNVHSWYERRAAEKAARSVPGVTEVRNKLVVTF